jgi:hypothetical protein
MPGRPLKRAAFLTSDSDEIEAFCQAAFMPSFKFEGLEWADEHPGPEVKTRTPPLELEDPPEVDVSVWANLEGPMVRVACVKCGQEKDAWVDEHGFLEDERDMWHVHEGDNAYPTAPIGESDDPS